MGVSVDEKGWHLFFPCNSYIISYKKRVHDQNWSFVWKIRMITKIYEKQDIRKSRGKRIWYYLRMTLFEMEVTLVYVWISWWWSVFSNMFCYFCHETKSTGLGIFTSNFSYRLICSKNYSVVKILHKYNRFRIRNNRLLTWNNFYYLS